MKILIDNSNLVAGGGIQVAISFLKDLITLAHDDQYIVVQSHYIANAINKEDFPTNFSFYNLDKETDKSKSKKIKFLKNFENKVSPDIIFTVFGPSYHKSNFPKVVGFAIPYIIYPESPFLKNISLKEKIYYKSLDVLKTYCFKKYSDALIFETDNAREVFVKKKNYKKATYTVSNTLNEVFYNKQNWKKIDIPQLDLTNANILCLTANYAHKNLAIIPKVIDALQKIDQDFKFKFYITLEQQDINFPEEYNSYIVFIGKIELSNIPSLYQQMNIIFIPTLLEVFSATYLEAMYMGKPIVASDMPFSRDICKDNALYCAPLKGEEYAKAIYNLKKDKTLEKILVKKGLENVKNFGTSMDRTLSYLDIFKKTLYASNKK
ncbi:Glycosyltransferase involved in cell wall bisynthesis [Soonwooa buanensis]|uniref:Glycosyltransferase involved in cell wall bisynthesis n=1 Tax=Soonwooa buanensis TaxID=619805 RepID=A0A1T5EUM1_9FLAO|nr:glycosyltransferase [Soonwooa buanensis]SKB87548.1 Glycosyltransferase involved in cell wall bisynthesis [Soonwooa buanensis]